MGGLQTIVINDLKGLMQACGKSYAAYVKVKNMGAADYTVKYHKEKAKKYAAAADEVLTMSCKATGMTPKQFKVILFKHLKETVLQELKWGFTDPNGPYPKTSLPFQDVKKLKLWFNGQLKF